MQLKEEMDAILKWRDYQKRLERRIEQSEFQIAS
jgi:hypothetical protein